MSQSRLSLIHSQNDLPSLAALFASQRPQLFCFMVRMMASTLSESSQTVGDRIGSSSMICSFSSFASSSELISRLSQIGSSWSFSSELESYLLIESGASRACRVVWCFLAFFYLFFDLWPYLVLQLTAGEAWTGYSSSKPHALLKFLMFSAICSCSFFFSSRSLKIFLFRRL